MHIMLYLKLNTESGVVDFKVNNVILASNVLVDSLKDFQAVPDKLGQSGKVVEIFYRYYGYLNGVIMYMIKIDTIFGDA